jgi:DNA helicase-2/ATP-dependent DNA helicase PcrA
LKDELEWVAKDIAGRGAGERAECVVLGRTKRLLDEAVAALENAGVPAFLQSRKDEFESAPFRWLHSLLRLANARGDKEQVRRVCKAFHGLEGVDIRVEQVTASASVTGGDLLRAWFDEAIARPAVSPLSKEFLTSMRGRIVTRLDVQGLIDVALDWFERLHGDESRDQEALGDYENELRAWKDLGRSIAERLGRDGVTLEAFLQEMDLASKAPPPPKDAVRCMTIHSAKGMEFRHVYLIGLVEDQLPSFQAVRKGKESRELQEERRNCFVAITRARDSLALTYSREYWGWKKSPSRFLSEMGVAA